MNMRNWYYLFRCIIACLGEEERWANVSSHEGGGCLTPSDCDKDLVRMNMWFNQYKTNFKL